MSETDAPVLDVRNLVVEFSTERGVVRAVDDVSFSVRKGETLGLVGESGCGKTVTCMALLGLIPGNGRIVGGEILIDGENLVGRSERELRQFRGRDVAMIFQEPMTALNPVFTVRSQLTEVLTRQARLGARAAQDRAVELLDAVGIPGPAERLNDYPHQLSGGMRQRVMIAMALACNPRILVADEPTTALDVTTQAQVIEQIEKIQRQFDMSVILVTHDLGIVAKVCERLLVMYCGEVVESGAATALFAAPEHPYTHGLLNAIPKLRRRRLDVLPVIPGRVPDLSDLPSGCYFQQRCGVSLDRCTTSRPSLTERDTRRVACFNPLESKAHD